MKPEKDNISAKIIISPKIDWAGRVVFPSAGLKDFIELVKAEGHVPNILPFVFLVRSEDVDCLINFNICKVHSKLWLSCGTLGQWKQFILSNATNSMDFKTRYLANCIYVELEKYGCNFYFTDCIKKDLFDGTFIIRRID